MYYLYHFLLEEECASPGPSLHYWLNYNKRVQNLQKLPLLFMEKGEILLLGYPFQGEGPIQHYESPLEKERVKVWGITPSLLKWATEKELLLEAPDPQLVKKLNHKAFLKPYLPQGFLQEAHSIAEIKALSETLKTKKCLKSVFSYSSVSTLLFDHFEEIQHHPLLKKGGSFILEPYLKKLFEFSTQWEIYPHKIELLGPTLLHVDALGHYKGTLIDSPEKLIPKKWFSFYQEHLEKASLLLEEVRKLGYFGPLGLDAFIYDEEGPRLLPFIDLNVRMTFGRAALECYWKHRKPLFFRLNLKKEFPFEVELL